MKARMAFPPTDPLLAGVTAFALILAGVCLVAALLVWMMARLLPATGVRVHGPFRLFRLLAKMAPWIMAAAGIALAASFTIGNQGTALGLMAIAAAAFCFFAFGWTVYALARRFGLLVDTRRFEVVPVPRRDGRLLTTRGAYVVILTVVSLAGTFTYPVFAWSFRQIVPLGMAVFWILLSVVVDIALLTYIRSPRCWNTEGKA